MEDPNLIKIEILQEYHSQIQKIIANSTQFQSVSDYVNYVLKEMLSANERVAKSNENDEAFQRRLKDLGYL
jgi:Arc/MetJ-type ribon-helix-helix transcriptional regulator